MKPRRTSAEAKSQQWRFRDHDGSDLSVDYLPGQGVSISLPDFDPTDDRFLAQSSDELTKIAEALLNASILLWNEGK